MAYTCLCNKEGANEFETHMSVSTLHGGNYLETCIRMQTSPWKSNMPTMIWTSPTCGHAPCAPQSSPHAQTNLTGTLTFVFNFPTSMTNPLYRPQRCSNCGTWQACQPNGCSIHCSTTCTCKTARPVSLKCMAMEEDELAKKMTRLAADGANVNGLNQTSEVDPINGKQIKHKLSTQRQVNTYPISYTNSNLNVHKFHWLASGARLIVLIWLQTRLPTTHKTSQPSTMSTAFARSVAPTLTAQRKPKAT